MEHNNLTKNFAELATSEDPTKILKHLIDIRKHVEWPRNKDNIAYIREHNHFKTIVDQFTVSKRSIIDVILSILGNCCLDAKCARDLVVQFNVFSNLNQIMKRYPKEDSINGRIFRIIGNVCVHKDQWASCIIDKKPQIVLHIVQFLKNSCTNTDKNYKITDGTIIMGVRALRELLNRETLKVLVDKYEVMKTVGMLLIKYTNQYEEDKKNEMVLMNLIKLLFKYSNYRYYPVISELKNADNGDALQCLPKILSITPKQIIKIVMNFLGVIHRMSELPIKELFDCFNRILGNPSVIDDFNQQSEEYLRCLCKLLEHPSNRNQKRCGNTITLLVEILQKITDNSDNNNSNNRVHCCVLIISTLNRCKYEDNLLIEQIKANIIDILTEKLIWIIGGIEPLKVDHINDRKRKTDCGCLSWFASKMKRDQLLDFSVISDESSSDDESSSSSSISQNSSDTDFVNKSRTDRLYSNDSDNELAMSCTSGLSPLSSPQRSQRYHLSESDSDDYSPICSDDDDDVTMTLPEIEDECYSDLQEQQLDDNQFLTNSTTAEPQRIDGIKMRLLFEIVSLLKTYTKLRPPIIQLANSRLLLGLIKSTNYFDWSYQTIDDIIDVTDRILLLNDYLLPLMKTNFIQLVYDLGYMQHDNTCSRCRHLKSLSGSILSKLSIVAESGAGRGDIAHKLLRGDVEIKQLLVTVLPYIIITKSILIKFMMNCGGLDVLMQLLRDNNEIKERTIKAICVMADRRLGIVNPKKITMSKKPTTIEQSPPFAPRSSTAIQQVAFRLDDGSVLQTDRELLSDSSDYFQRLLNGNFRESKENEIELHNVLYKSFKLLLNLIECKIIDTNQSINIDIDLLTYLDIISLCDRFLMQNYCLYLTSCIEQYYFKATTIPLIYQWSMESGTNFLRIECIAYALVAKIVDSERVEMFKSLLDLGYTDELINDIRTLLVRHMNVQSFELKKKRKRPTHYILCRHNDPLPTY